MIKLPGIYIKMIGFSYLSTMVIMLQARDDLEDIDQGHS